MHLSEIKKILLIGNGPSALEHKAKDIINNFPCVLRFNNYHLDGYEKHVGTKCDLWSTVDKFPQLAGKIRVKHIFFITGRIQHKKDIDTASFLKRRTLYNSCIILDGTYLSRVSQIIGAWPSSGAIITNYMLNLGVEIFLYGFDFFCSSKHHYGDNIDLGPNHQGIKEKEYFLKLYESNKMQFLFKEDAKKLK